LIPPSSCFSGLSRNCFLTFQDSGLTDYQGMAEMHLFDIGLAHVNYSEQTFNSDDEERISEAIYEIN
jgi:hypothetical protein